MQANDCSASTTPVSTPDNTKGSPPTLTQFSPTAFDAEPNHSHLLVLYDGTNWTAPRIELEFRSRLEALLENEFKEITVPDLLTAGQAVEGKNANASEAKCESSCPEHKGDEDTDEEEEISHQSGSQPSLTKPPRFCVLVIGGSYGMLSNIMLLCGCESMERDKNIWPKNISKNVSKNIYKIK